MPGEREGWMVDITGVQFPDNNDPVCVSRRSAWHAGFEIDIEHQSDIDLYDDFTRFNMGTEYKRISLHLQVHDDPSH
jgi:hypothetical protein